MKKNVIEKILIELKIHQELLKKLKQLKIKKIKIF